jgi:hypothetical protein
MSRHRIEVTVTQPTDAVAAACQEAVAQLGWRILAQSQSSITCKEVASTVISFTWPAEIEVSWVSRGGNTVVTFSGSIFGLGSVQSNHLKGQIGNLQNRITLRLRDSQQERVPSVPSSSLASELTKLAELRSQGILSQEEFQAAKAKLIG